jgi:hypothetical protein
LEYSESISEALRASCCRHREWEWDSNEVEPLGQGLSKLEVQRREPNFCFPTCRSSSRASSSTDADLEVLFVQLAVILRLSKLEAIGLSVNVSIVSRYIPLKLRSPEEVPGLDTNTDVRLAGPRSHKILHLNHNNVQNIVLTNPSTPEKGSRGGRGNLRLSIYYFSREFSVGNT